MKAAVIGAVVVMLALNTTILYAAIVVAGKYDDMMEEYCNHCRESAGNRTAQEHVCTGTMQHSSEERM